MGDDVSVKPPTARERAREAVLTNLGSPPAWVLPQAIEDADLASDVWEHYVERILAAVDGVTADDGGDVAAEVLAICKEALNG